MRLGMKACERLIGEGMSAPAAVQVADVEYKFADKQEVGFGGSSGRRKGREDGGKEGHKERESPRRASKAHPLYFLPLFLFALPVNSGMRP